MLELYREYVRRLRARLGPDGALRPLAPWEERFPPGRLLMKLFMGLRQEEGLAFITSNLVRHRSIFKQIWYSCRMMCF
jgi:hypothetical protein